MLANVTMTTAGSHDGSLGISSDSGVFGGLAPSSAGTHFSDASNLRSSDKILVTDDTSLPEHVREENYPIPYEPSNVNVAQGGAYPSYDAYNQKMQPHNVEEPSQAKPAGCCGLSRKATWVVGIIAAVVVVGAIVGGIAGGLASRNNRDSQGGGSDDDATDSDSSGNDDSSRYNTTLVDTNIAAINFTDSSNATRRALFYQREAGSLWLSLSPSSEDGNGNGNSTTDDANNNNNNNTTWKQIDISAVFSRIRNPDLYTAPKNGTPLAAAAIPPGEADFLGHPFAVGLYYLDEENRVRELVSYDGDGEGPLEDWVVGGMQDYTFDAGDNDDSQLAVAPHFCADGCANAFCVAYQDRYQTLGVACGDAWDRPQTLETAYPGTSLAMVPFASDNGKNVTKANWMRLFWQRDNTFLVLADNDGEWGIGGLPFSFFFFF